MTKRVNDNDDDHNKEFHDPEKISNCFFLKVNFQLVWNKGYHRTKSSAFKYIFVPITVLKSSSHREGGSDVSELHSATGFIIIYPRWYYSVFGLSLKEYLSSFCQSVRFWSCLVVILTFVISELFACNSHVLQLHRFYQHFPNYRVRSRHPSHAGRQIMWIVFFNLPIAMFIPVRFEWCWVFVLSVFTKFSCLRLANEDTGREHWTGHTVAKWRLTIIVVLLLWFRSS